MLKRWQTSEGVADSKESSRSSHREDSGGQLSYCLQDDSQAHERIRLLGWPAGGRGEIPREEEAQEGRDLLSGNIIVRRHDHS